MKRRLRKRFTFAVIVVCMGVLVGGAQAQTVYQGTSGVDLDSATAWSSGIPDGQTATISVAGANLPRWQDNMSSGTIVNHTAGVLTFTSGPYNAFGASGVSDFTYNMSGGGMTGSGQEINVNQHTFNLSGGDIISTLQFRLLNSGVLNVSGSGTLDAPTIAGTVGTMNFTNDWTGSVTIDDLDAAGWKTMLATTLAGSAFDGTDITTANFDSIFMVNGSVLSLRTQIAWDAGSGTWTTGGNWDSGTAPVTGDGMDVDIDDGAGNDDIQFNTTYTVQSGRFLQAGTRTGFHPELALQTGSDLTLASGGTMDLAFMRPRGTCAFTIEAGATLDTDNFGLGSKILNITFEANASGVTTWNNPGQCQIHLDNLTVDLSNYDLANGSTLVLVDYGGTLTGTFASTNLTTDWSGSIDYAYDQGGGDLAIALTGLSRTLTWDDGAGDDNWSSAANWDVGGGDPASGPQDGDSVVLTTTAQSRLDGSWTIESGKSLTSLTSGFGDELVLESSSDLTLATGGTMDVGFMRPRFSSGGLFTIEAGASLNTDQYGVGSISGGITFAANAAGVTPWNNSGQYQIGLDNLTVDLTSYDISNGDTLVLVDYDGALSGVFASTNLSTDWSGTLDYTYDQGGGDLAIALTGLSRTLTWDDGAGDDNWSSAANWDVGGGDPLSGPADGDNVVLTATAQNRLNYAWTIESGRSLTSLSSGTGDELVLESGAALTLATGGTMDLGFMRPRFSSGGQFTIQAGASLNTDQYGLGSISGGITFDANAAGVTTWNNSGDFEIPLDALTVDLTSYDISNGSTLILVDYDGALSGTFASVVITGLRAEIDYAYDQGGGDLAIALTNVRGDTTVISFR